MKFGWLASHESNQPEVLIDQAVRAEEVGFDAVFASDHFHPWVDQDSASGFVWSWFGAAVARTEHIEFATSVTCPLYHYHPALIAQAAATVDRLSAGRFFLGVGTGENINSGPLGYPFPGYTERIARMDEALQIMHRLLDGEKVDFDGEFYTCDKAMLYSPPVSEVPIYMAAAGPKSAAFAGRNADGLIVSVKDPADTLERAILPFRKAAQEQGRGQLPVMGTRWVVWADDDDEAWEALAAMRGLRAPGRLEAVDPMVLRKRADEMDRQDILGRYTVVSTVDQLIEAYAPLVTQIGAQYISVQIAAIDLMTTIDRVGKEVLPALRSMAPETASGAA
ncbi:MAG: TIGR03557 family F420-dependent LLM class oxidoreductase [Actinomycetota bacterium]